MLRGGSRVNQVDKRRVRGAFSRSAQVYDSRAAVQRLVRERVLALAGAAAPHARRVLDVGAGTGALLARIEELRPALSAFAVDLAPGMCRATHAAAPRAGVAAADAEALPFRAGAFDLVVSTSTFQWLPGLGPALAEARRVLAPGGTLCVALFGTRTLIELREAWRAASGPDAPGETHTFLGRDDVAHALEQEGFPCPSVIDEELVEWHEDARAMLRALKEVGATSAVPGRAGLGGRGRTLEMLRRYDELGTGRDGVPATYHVVYAVARRATATPPSPPAP